MKKAQAVIKYRDACSQEIHTHIYWTSDLGDAFSYIEHVFRLGYLTRRVTDNHYEFVPISRVISAEATNAPPA